MTNFKQAYLQKLKKYLYSAPFIEVRGKTYYNIETLRSAIIDCEMNARSRDFASDKDITLYTRGLGSLMTLYRDDESAELLMEIDSLVRSPQNLRALPAFSRQTVNFQSLIHDLKQAQSDKAKLKKIARVLARDAYIAKILRFNYNVNAIISSCAYLGNDGSINHDKIDARLLTNTRTEEMIRFALSLGDMPFKYILGSQEIIYDGHKYNIEEYLDVMLDKIQDEVKDSFNTQNPQQIHTALDSVKQHTSKVFNVCHASLVDVDKKLNAITITKQDSINR